MLRQRYRRILWFFARILLNMIWWEVILPKIGLRRLARPGSASTSGHDPPEEPDSFQVIESGGAGNRIRPGAQPFTAKYGG